MNTIEAAIADVPGAVGLAARRLKPGEQISHRAGEVFFTASTF